MRTLKRWKPFLCGLAALLVALMFPLSVRAAETVTATVLPGVTVSGSTELVTGATVSTTVRLPGSWTPVSFASGSGAQQVEVKWVDKRTYSASATTFDLTGLTAAATNTGAAAFAKIKVISITNNATTSGYNLTLFNAAATSFQANVSSSGTVTIGPGETYLAFNLTSAGWACSTNKSLKIDPGANNVPATIVLVGN